MREKGWLSCKEEPSPRGPARKVYRRSAAGTRALFKWLKGGPIVGQDRLAYIGQLISLGQLGDHEVTRRFLEALRANFLERRELLRKAEAYYRSELPGDRAMHELFAVLIGVRTDEARVAACDEALAILDEETER